MPFDHLRILAHFNRARDELKSAEEVLASLPQVPDDINAHLLMQLSRDVVIEIRRIEYLIRQEIRRREKMTHKKAEH